MATATAPIIGKRKRLDGRAKAPDDKKPTVRQTTKQDLAKARASALKVHSQPAIKPPTAISTQPPTQLETEPEVDQVSGKSGGGGSQALTSTAAQFKDGYLNLQLVTGSYERVLHGISARIPRHLLQSAAASNGTTNGAASDSDSNDTVTYSDTFLFAAHSASIRCLAVSPPTESDKRYLATGSSDERINVYSISTVPPTSDRRVDLPSLASNTTVENPRNRSLGSLIHHDRAITRLEFPAKGKLFSAAEDNTVAISRTRDWTVLSSIKAPIPKPQGRPSGDTAGPGEVPAGVNDFAIHPSQKLMLSVGRGERCLRLWNLMTGKKAGVLNFDRSLLTQVGESKYSSGEGRQVLWNEAGDAYVVGFERGAAVFGIDSKPQALIKPSPSTKLHQFRMARSTGSSETGELLAVSTEDGRILFFDTKVPDPANSADKLPVCRCVAQLGGPGAGVSGRIKDFEMLELAVEESPVRTVLVVVTVSSDGAIRLWNVTENLSEITAGPKSETQQVGNLIGTLETGNRITCLGAFVLDGKSDSKAIVGSEEADVGAEDEEVGSGESE